MNRYPCTSDSRWLDRELKAPTREDDGTFAVRQVLQNKSVINSALATFASLGAEQEKARQLLEEQKAVEEQRAAARAALKAA